MKDNTEYIDGIDLTCDLSEVVLTEEDELIRENLVKFLNESINNVSSLRSNDYIELTKKQQINKLIQNGLLNIIDNLELNDLKIANKLHEHIDRNDKQRYNDDTISLILLNTLVQTIDDDCRVIDIKKLEKDGK